MDDYCRPNLSPSTFDSYQRIIKKHIIPALGAIPLAKLLPLHLQGYYSDKLHNFPSGRFSIIIGLFEKF
ncbi:N-terminal phage integrase SAM-like domain-containing protein [Desulfofundulus australicus]|uniref:N-terminal phage integrase SAM-like domain-containing protein n=1 Tax=Desulfofundulus australicus TaxID=1566 RepID=UPI0009F91E85